MCETAEKGTVILFNGELDKAMAAFIIATGAASMGIEVTIFFTFWGLNCLWGGEARPEAPSKSSMGKLLDVMNPGGADKLPLTHLDMMGMGRKMMAKVMQKKGISSLPELMATAHELDVRMVACQMSMDALEISRDEFIFDDVEIGGIAAFLAEASESKFTLFI